MSDWTLYPVKIVWSDEDYAYVATATDLPGCSAVSESRIGAAKEIGPAIRAWIKAAKAAGNPIPKPSH